MKKRRYALCLCIVAAASTLPLASRLVNDMCVNETGNTKVLIGMQNGQFKDSVMATVKFALENDSYCVKVIPLGDLGDEVMENYAACIVVNTCHCGKIGGKASKFLKRLSAREKGRVLLFTTTGGDSAKVRDAGVDAVTSASRLKNARSVADTIVTRTREILHRKR